MPPSAVSKNQSPGRKEITEVSIYQEPRIHQRKIQAKKRDSVDVWEIVDLEGRANTVCTGTL